MVSVTCISSRAVVITRMPSLGAPQTRDLFLKILNEVRQRYDFALIGYVVMPEHIHLLISEPNVGNPSLVMKALKEQVLRELQATVPAIPSGFASRLLCNPKIG